MSSEFLPKDSFLKSSLQFFCETALHIIQYIYATIIISNYSTPKAIRLIVDWEPQ